MEEKKHPISELMGVTMQKIREMVDANTIIGQPIQAEGMTLIPISRLTFGFASGGSDYASKNQKPDAANSFGGGSGAGGTSGGGYHRPGTQRYPDGKAWHHRETPSFGGNPGLCQCGLLG